MSEKSFSVRSNAIRNARSHLGKGAKQGTHFTVGGTKGSYTWAPIEGAPAVGAIQEAAANAKVDTLTALIGSPERKAKAKPAKRAKVKVKAARRKPVRVTSKARKPKDRGRKVGRKSLSNAGQVSGKRKTMFKLISSPHGASLDHLSNVLGWQKHTVRGAVSTISSQFKVKVKSFRDKNRGRVYKVA